MGLAQTTFDPVLRWPKVFSPLAASLLELVVVWLWHTPALHQAAGRLAAAQLAEQFTFLASGFYLWISVLGGRQAERSAVGIVALLLTLMHMTLLGALIALAPRPLYSHHHNASLAPLEDQQLGGVSMIAAGGLSYLTGALWLAARLLWRDRRY